MGDKGQKKKVIQEGGIEIKDRDISSGGFAARVLEIEGVVNSNQGGYQVKCKVLEGGEAGKTMRRNVFGPVRIGDILTLVETELEASPIKSRKG